jgi:hypothetical protein
MKKSPALPASGLMTRIRQRWCHWRGRAPERTGANAANHAPRPENFAGKWPDADAVLAWRLSATAESDLRNPLTGAESSATIEKQETP